MALPIVYLPIEVPNPNPKDGTGSFYSRRARSKQAKPYNLPAAYDVRRCFTVNAALKGKTTSFSLKASAGSTGGDYECSPDLTLIPIIKEHIDEAVFKARSALIGTLNEQALLATNYIERQQAMAMMTQRLFQLVDFARAVRRGDIRSAAWILRNRSRSESTYRGVRRDRWTNSKDAANTWLEYHFGWEPLIQDVYNVVKLFSDPVPCGYVSTTRLGYPPGKVKFDKSKVSRTSWGTDVQVIQRRVVGYAKAKGGCEFYVTNPNLYLANRLGLVNPAAIAWEAIPFSFVVDWFTTVGAWINQYSDFAGITVKNPWFNWRAQVNVSYDQTDTSNKVVTGGMTVEKSCFNSRRFLFIPQVELRVRPLKRISVTRAATAIALLIQLLPNHRSKADIDANLSIST